MSETPLTDAVNLHLRTRREYVKTDHEIWFEHGEALELRVSDLSEERDELREEIKSLKETILDQESHILELQSRRPYTPGYTAEP